MFVGKGDIMHEYRLNIKNFLREKLLGKENQEIKNKFMEELGFSNENIKTYTNLNVIVVPPFETFPDICKFFNVTLYEFMGIDDPYELTEEDRKRLKAIKDNKALSEVIDSVIGSK